MTSKRSGSNGPAASSWEEYISSTPFMVNAHLDVNRLSRRTSTQIMKYTLPSMHSVQGKTHRLLLVAWLRESNIRFAWSLDDVEDEVVVSYLQKSENAMAYVRDFFRRSHSMLESSPAGKEFLTALQKRGAHAFNERRSIQRYLHPLPSHIDMLFEVLSGHFMRSYPDPLPRGLKKKYMPPEVHLRRVQLAQHLSAVLELFSSTMTHGMLCVWPFVSDFFRHRSHLFDGLLLALNTDDSKLSVRVKNLLMDCFDRYVMLRQRIGNAVINYMYSILETPEDRHTSVRELLEILARYIETWPLPFSAEHRVILKNVLVPLHSLKDYPSFQPSLQALICGICDLDPSVTPFILRGILERWPVTFAKKETHILYELQVIIEGYGEDPKLLFPVCGELFKRLWICAHSANSQVYQVACTVLESESVIGLFCAAAERICSEVVPYILWNTASSPKVDVHNNIRLHVQNYHLQDQYSNVDGHLFYKHYDSDQHPFCMELQIDEYINTPGHSPKTAPLRNKSSLSEVVPVCDRMLWGQGKWNAPVAYLADGYLGLIRGVNAGVAKRCISLWDDTVTHLNAERHTREMTWESLELRHERALGKLALKRAQRLKDVAGAFVHRSPMVKKMKDRLLALPSNAPDTVRKGQQAVTADVCRLKEWGMFGDLDRDAVYTKSFGRALQSKSKPLSVAPRKVHMSSSISLSPRAGGRKGSMDTRGSVGRSTPSTFLIRRLTAKSEEGAPAPPGVRPSAPDPKKTMSHGEGERWTPYSASNPTVHSRLQASFDNTVGSQVVSATRRAQHDDTFDVNVRMDKDGGLVVGTGSVSPFSSPQASPRANRRRSSLSALLQDHLRSEEMGSQFGEAAGDEENKQHKLPERAVSTDSKQQRRRTLNQLVRLSSTSSDFGTVLDDESITQDVKAGGRTSPAGSHRRSSLRGDSGISPVIDLSDSEDALVVTISDDEDGDKVPQGDRRRSRGGSGPGEGRRSSMFRRHRLSRGKRGPSLEFDEESGLFGGSEDLEAAVESTDQDQRDLPLERKRSRGSGRRPRHERGSLKELTARQSSEWQESFRKLQEDHQTQQQRTSAADQPHQSTSKRMPPPSTLNGGQGADSERTHSSSRQSSRRRAEVPRTIPAGSTRPSGGSRGGPDNATSGTYEITSGRRSGSVQSNQQRASRSGASSSRASGEGTGKPGTYSMTSRGARMLRFANRRRLKPDDPMAKNQKSRSPSGQQRRRQ